MERWIKELNSQNSEQGTCPVKFERNRMPEKTVETAALPPMADIATSLNGWSVTAKRGRSEIRKLPVVAAIDPQPVEDSDRLHASQKLRKFVENHSEKQNEEVEEVGSSSIVADSHELKKQKTQSAIDVAEEKLIKAETKEAAERIIQEDSGTSSRQKYTCTTCNRGFHSHQALGGHRSSHNKLKISIINAKHEDPSGNNNNNGKINVVSRGQSSSYICKICTMSFSSGQALGMHKRSHKDEDDKKNETAGMEFEIDLNKLPDEL